MPPADFPLHPFQRGCQLEVGPWLPTADELARPWGGAHRQVGRPEVLPNIEPGYRICSIGSTGSTPTSF